MARSDKSATVTPLRGKGDNVKSLEAQENAAKNEALSAISDFHKGDEMMGSATQRTAHAVLVLRNAWVSKGDEPIHWGEYVKGGKGKSGYDNKVITFLLGKKPTLEPGKKPTGEQSKEIGRRFKTEQMIRRAIEFAAYLTLQQIGMDKFVNGFWIVSPTDCVYSGYTPNVKNPIPLDGRQFSANRPPREELGEKSDSDIRVIAGVAAFIKAQKPEATRAARTPAEIMSAIEQCTIREVLPLADKLYELFMGELNDDGSREEYDLVVSDYNVAGDSINKAWDAVNKLARRINALNNDTRFMETEEKETPARKSA
jgi:hypothetical protein